MSSLADTSDELLDPSVGKRKLSEVFADLP